MGDVILSRKSEILNDLINEKGGLDNWQVYVVGHIADDDLGLAYKCPAGCRPTRRGCKCPDSYDFGSLSVNKLADFINELNEYELIKSHDLLSLAEGFQHYELYDCALVAYDACLTVSDPSSNDDIKYLAKSFRGKGMVALEQERKLDAQRSFDMAENLLIQYGRVFENSRR